MSLGVLLTSCLAAMMIGECDCTPDDKKIWTKPESCKLRDLLVNLIKMIKITQETLYTRDD